MPDSQLAREAAGLLSLSDPSESRSLNQLAELAARQVRGCSGALADLWRDGIPARTAQTHPVLAGLTELQHETGEGPVIEAQAGGGPVGCPDTLRELRWPAFARAAFRRGVRSSLTLAYASDRDTVTLTVVGARPRVIDPDQASLAALLASLGGTAISNAAEYGEARRTALQLSDSVEARALVDQAKGVLMQALACSPYDALDRMREISQTHGLKVTDVARKVIEARGTEI
jgi:hypothetical protein